MPWGNKSEDHNQESLTPKQKKAVNRVTRQVNQEAKRRVQTRRHATNQDGNKGTR
jgi:hypothetical protein